MKEIITEILTLVGVTLGWGLSELTRFWINTEQKKQTLNTALSVLLDIYFHLKRIQEMHRKIHEFLDWYTSAIKGHTLRDDEVVEVKNLLTKSLVPTMLGIVSDDMNTISSKYEESMEKLSCYYPVAAYRLRGQANIEHILLDLNKYSTKIEENLSLQITNYLDMLVPAQEQLQPILFENQLSVLRKELLELAKETNCKHRKEIIGTVEYIEKSNAMDSAYLEALKRNVLDLIEVTL